MPTGDKPWELNGYEYQSQVALGDEWWTKATPADRRKLWDMVVIEYSDSVLDVMSDLAQLKFFEMVQRFPNLKIGD